ncbi:MAG: hypothetical protein JW913_12295 [Chitinispirillaceae bacterium]|nr:hypothetical protein [Chitinispirillaceae bacterium]
MTMRLWRQLELEWKVLLLAAGLFVAFAWPVQRFVITRLSETLFQSIDPDLETTLRAELADAEGGQRGALKEHIERYRQTRVLMPIVVKEQQRLLIALSIGLFMLFLLLALWVLKRLTRPLKDLARAVDRIGKGETAQVARVSEGALGIVEQAVVNLQEELVALREQARMQGMETAWKDIARVMAHEIKNPLTPIRLTLDRMEERSGSGRGVSNEDLTKFLTRINAQVDMLERLVDQFRSFSREPEVRLAAVDCAALLRTVADGMGRSLTTTIEGAATIQSDPYLLQQIFLNLLKNSLDAGADRVSAVIGTGVGAVTIALQDNGPGIPPAHLGRIWLPYVTFMKNGSGLGLAVVKQLVETLRGAVSLVSPPGQGVRITLTFPTDLTGEN